MHAVDDIFRPNLGSLKGKTVRHPNPHMRSGVSGVPPDIMKVHNQHHVCEQDTVPHDHVKEPEVWHCQSIG